MNTERILECVAFALCGLSIGLGIGALLILREEQKWLRHRRDQSHGCAGTYGPIRITALGKDIFPDSDPDSRPPPPKED